MPSKKPTIIFIADDDLFERIEDFRFENRIANRSEAIRILVEAGLKAKPKTPKKKKWGSHEETKFIDTCFYYS